MIKPIFFLLSGCIFLNACNPGPPRKNDTSGERIELTPFIAFEIMIRDTMQIKTLYAQADSGRMSIPAYLYNQDLDGRFLDIREMKTFRKAMWEVIHHPGTHVYLGADLHPVTASELRDRIVMCDSIKMMNYDDEGKEIISTIWTCDSISALYNVDKIRFFEARYFNPENGMIECETLGYSVLSYAEEKQAHQELFCVFRNEDAVKKAREFYTSAIKNKP